MEPRTERPDSASARWARRVELIAWFLLPVPIMVLAFGTWVAVGYAGYSTTEMCLVVGFGLLASVWAGSKWANLFGARFAETSWTVRASLTAVPVVLSALALVAMLLALMDTSG